LAINWYLKKEYWDGSDDIQSVTIHYTTAAVGQAPDWHAQHESRPMPANEELRSGVGQFSKYGPTAPKVPQIRHPRLRKKVLSLPQEVWDGRTGAWTAEYNLHYFYEVLQRGQRRYSPIHTDEIRTREVVFVIPNGEVVNGACAYWSVADWDAPQFSPTEDPRFVATFGEEHPLRAHKFYAADDKDSFSQYAQWFEETYARHLMPYPRRHTTRISAPVGATVG
jgi:hypothetical protein